MEISTATNPDNSRQRPRANAVYILELEPPAQLADLNRMLAAHLAELVNHSRQSVLLILRDGPPSGVRVDDINTVTTYEKLVRQLERWPLPIIACVTGRLDIWTSALLFVADRRIAGPGMALALAGAPGMAVLPGTGLFRLAHQAGAALARQLYNGRVLAASACLEHGLIDEIVSDAEGSARAAAPAASPDAVILRRLLDDAPSSSYEEALGPHLAACERLLRTRADAGA